MKLGLVFLLFLLFPILLVATTQPYPFAADQIKLEKRFNHLSQSLRCLVCQNESLADSTAALAQDLRRQVYEKIQQGQSDKQIKHYLVARYGDFILFKPPLISRTILLWVLPFVFILTALCSWRFTLSLTDRLDPLSEQAQKKAQALLQNLKVEGE